jgi:two-component system, chemotaxis family, protein-glutamate methylesterase/glutaminase
MSIRVLVVDDSATMRAVLTTVLERESDIDVVGAAADAVEARTLIRDLNPDVVTLDLEMPGMNGLDFLERIMRLRPTPVIVVSGVTGADTTIRALQLGAIDYYAKPDGADGNLLTSDYGRLARLVRGAALMRLSRPLRDLPVKTDLGPIAARVPRASRPAARLIAIGASTGGVEALHELLAGFPADCPPTLIVQHISEKFAAALAHRLDAHCRPRVVLAEPDTRLERGTISIAHGNGRHLAVRASEGGFFSRLRPGDPVGGHRPSIDTLFYAVAEAAPEAAIGILLTGMGADGAQGLLVMRRAGCFTIAQDEASSTVYGMPRVAAQIGAAEAILPLSLIAARALGAGFAAARAA